MNHILSILFFTIFCQSSLGLYLYNENDEKDFYPIPSALATIIDPATTRLDEIASLLEEHNQNDPYSPLFDCILPHASTIRLTHKGIEKAAKFMFQYFNVSAKEFEATSDVRGFFSSLKTRAQEESNFEKIIIFDRSQMSEKNPLHTALLLFKIENNEIHVIFIDSITNDIFTTDIQNTLRDFFPEASFFGFGFQRQYSENGCQIFSLYDLACHAKTDLWSFVALMNTRDTLDPAKLVPVPGKSWSKFDGIVRIRTTGKERILSFFPPLFMSCTQSLTAIGNYLNDTKISKEFESKEFDQLKEIVSKFTVNKNNRCQNTLIDELTVKLVKDIVTNFLSQEYSLL